MDHSRIGATPGGSDNETVEKPRHYVDVRLFFDNGTLKCGVTGAYVIINDVKEYISYGNGELWATARELESSDGYRAAVKFHLEGSLSGKYDCPPQMFEF